MTLRPFANQQDGSTPPRSGPALLDQSDSWLGAEAGVRSQPGWSPKPEPTRISPRRWKLVRSAMLAAGLTIGFLIGLGVGSWRSAQASGPRDEGQGS